MQKLMSRSFCRLPHKTDYDLAQASRNRRAETPSTLMSLSEQKAQSMHEGGERVKHEKTYDMKRIGIILVAALALLSCQQNKELSRVATGEPIMPIRLTGETTEVYVTDYLPTVTLEDTVWTVTDNGKVDVLTVGQGKDRVDIPILPRKPFKEGLTTLGITDDMLFLDCEENILPLHFLCLVQNQALPEDVISIGADGHPLFDLTRIPKLKGRSYLRIYAWNDKVLLNDLLIPLQDGYPVLSADQLTRHDANAQVLYSILVDRFFDGKTANDAPLTRPDVDPRVDY